MKTLLIGLCFLLVSNVLLAQEQKSYYENGQLKLVGTLKEGKKSGEWKYYHDNGQLWKLQSYEAGQPTGEWKFCFNTGQIGTIGKYENGLKIGEWKYYRKDGKLKEIGNYSEGKQTGEWKNYHPNGQLYQTKIYDNDLLMNLTACLDGEGKELERGTLKDGNGTIKEYNAQGDFLSEYTIADGRMQY